MRAGLVVAGLLATIGGSVASCHQLLEVHPDRWNLGTLLAFATPLAGIALLVVAALLRKRPA